METLPSSNAEHLDKARDINRLHGEARQLARTAVEKALEAGHLLHEAKRSLPHGRFKAWVENNTEVSYRTASKYMKVAQFERDGVDLGGFEGGVDALLKQHSRPPSRQPNEESNAPSFSIDDHPAEAPKDADLGTFDADDPERDQPAAAELFHEAVTDAEVVDDDRHSPPTGREQADDLAVRRIARDLDNGSHQQLKEEIKAVLERHFVVRTHASYDEISYRLTLLRGVIEGYVNARKIKTMSDFEERVISKVEELNGVDEIFVSFRESTAEILREISDW